MNTHSSIYSGMNAVAVKSSMFLLFHCSFQLFYSTQNLRYADDTTLMAESEEELKSLLMKVKEESEKVG